MATEPSGVFEDVLVNCFNVELFWKDWDQDLKNFLPATEGGGAVFRRKLAEAILHYTISPERYYELTTDDSYPTREELNEWLREVWEILYGDAPVSEDGP